MGMLCGGMKVTYKKSGKYECSHLHSYLSKKRLMDCVKEDMRIKAVSTEMTSDRGEWKKKTCCGDPT
jgi:hypothetical protein